MDRILYKGAKEIKESDMTLCFVVCPRKFVRSAMWKKGGRGQGEDSKGPEGMIRR